MVSFTPITTMKFRISFGTKGLSVEESDLPNFPQETIELDCTCTLGDLFRELYSRNPTEPGYEWSLASPVDRLIFRYPCKNNLALIDAFSSPALYNEKGEVEIVADQDHLLTEATTIMKDYDFMISLIKKLPIPAEQIQRRRVITCLSKVITGIINRIRYRPESPQFCYPNCIHQVEFNKLRVYANSVADGSIFGLNAFPSCPQKTIESCESEEKCSHRHKRTRRDNSFPIEELPEEIMMHVLSFASPKDLCNFEQASTEWKRRVNVEDMLWSKFCNGWKLRDEDEIFLGFKNVVKTVYEIQAARRLHMKKI